MISINAYRELRARNPELYAACIRSADALGIRHTLPTEVTAELEEALVTRTLDALNMKAV